MSANWKSILNAVDNDILPLIHIEEVAVHAASNACEIKIRCEGDVSAPAREEIIRAFQDTLNLCRVEVRFADPPAPREDVVRLKAASVMKKADKPRKNRVIYGRDIKGNTAPIGNINGDTGRCVVSGKLFRLDIRDTKQGKFKIVRFNVTDGTGSIIVSRPVETREAERLEETLKNGAWVTVRGDYLMDRYVKDWILAFTDISLSENLTPTDDAEIKRVELHAHTKMSAQDAVVEASELVARAGFWGHPAIAITDHGVVQAYPQAYQAAKKAGVKLILGCEGYLIGDSIDQETVVFDLETTGLDASRGNIIEIGAVRVVNGKICGEFSTLVNPRVKLSDTIVEMTGITDDMLKNAPDIGRAMSEFMEFVGDSALAAHNATFDMSFLKAEAERLGVEVMNPVMDTLTMARALYPNEHKHGLASMVKLLNVELAHHHRALDDARATAYLFIEFAAQLKQKGCLTIADAQGIQRANIPRSKSNHIVILAKDEAGLHNLYQLVSSAHIDYFYKRPLIPKDLLKRRREGLILGSACERGEVFQAILNGADTETLISLAKFYDYLEIQPVGNNRFMVREGRVADDEALMELNKRVVEIADAAKLPVAATCDVHFLDEKDEYYRRVIQAGNGYQDADMQAPLFFRTTGQMLEEFSYLGDRAHELVVDNPNKIAEMCKAMKPFPDDKTYTPHIDGADVYIRELTIKTAHEKYGDVLPEIVEKRIEKELRSIIDYGFAVLYYIAQKLVAKSLSDGYLVGSRGSVGSSLVAYLTGITEVNPLAPHYVCPKCRASYFDVDADKYPCGIDLPERTCECGVSLRRDGYDIPFEVFLGFEGDKVPDIDLNFSGEYQPVAHKYIEELFGHGYVFRAGTVSALKDKTAYGYVMKYAESRGLTLGGAEIDRLVAGCSGVKKTTGQHPGGIIIVPQDTDIYAFTPVQHPADAKGKGIVTTHFDFGSMHDVLVKVDVLGHDVPTTLRILENLTGVDPRTVNLSDSETMSLFTSTMALGTLTADINSNVATYGIPEFGTRFVRGMLMDTKPKTFEELIRISGLSHGTDVWLNNASDVISAGTATLREAICTRDDIMNYLIHKGVEPLTAFNAMERVRKGKRLSEDQEEAMRASRVPEWYIESCNKIKYMFPKAHAAAYVMMAFRIAWYKVNHPLAFYAAYFTVRPEAFDSELIGLSAEELSKLVKRQNDKWNDISAKERDTLTNMEIMLEMKARGLSFHQVDINRSDARAFTIEDGAIRLPFLAIAGLGEAVADSIVRAREEREFYTIDDLMERTRINKTHLEKMRECGCVDGLPQSDQLSLF